MDNHLSNFPINLRTIMRLNDGSQHPKQGRNELGASGKAVGISAETLRVFGALQTRRALSLAAGTGARKH
jgi:hypothetical protein